MNKNAFTIGNRTYELVSFLKPGEEIFIPLCNVHKEIPAYTVVKNLYD